MYAHILSYIFPAARMAFLVTLLCLGVVREGYGQRVYANSEQHSDKQVVVVLTVSEVTNPTNSTNSSDNTYSTLNVAVGALNLYSATQNLQFTGTNATKLRPTSPIMVKTMVNGSILGLLDAVSLQRTNGGMNNTVGNAYTVTQLLDLLGIIGGTNEELLVVLPVPGATQPNDGVQLKVNSVLSLGLSARLYYAFYITPPEMQSTVSACIGETVPVTVTNYNATLGYTYRLYSSLTNGSVISGATFSNGTLTLPENLPTGTYYLEAREGDLYPSARTPITLARNEVSGGLITANQILCSNVTPAQLTPTTPASGSGTLTYQWQSRTSSGSFQDISGATGLTYSPPALTETMIYRRVATSTLNGIACQANSNEITITVYPVPGISLASSTIEACQGDDVNLTYITTTNDPISYSIDWNAQAEGAGFVDIFNETYSFLTTEDTIPITVLPGIATGNYQGILTVRNSNGCTSNGQIIMINILPKPPAPEITVQ